MPSFQLHPGVAAHAIAQHPLQPDVWAVCGGQHFGLAGSGRIYIVAASRGLGFVAGCALPEAAFGVCFPDPASPLLVAVAGGDGVKAVQLLPAAAGAATPGGIGRTLVPPPTPQQQHQGEATCCRSDPRLPGIFVSGGFDGTVRTYRIDGGGAGLLCVSTLGVPGFAMTPVAPKTFDVALHPMDAANIVASAHGDGTWRVWDRRQPPQAALIASGGGPQLGLVNTVDWCPADPGLLAVASNTGAVLVFDMRRPQMPVCDLSGGHRAAVRRARWSPHARTHLLTCGFDFAVRLWDVPIGGGGGVAPRLIHSYEHHREFAHDCAWDTSRPGGIASCGWDGMMFLWQAGGPPTMSPPQPLPQWPEPMRAPGAPRLVMMGQQQHAPMMTM